LAFYSYFLVYILTFISTMYILIFVCTVDSDSIKGKKEKYIMYELSPFW